MPVLDNDKHEQFCNEYLKDLNLTKAYMRTYPDSKATASASSSSALLRNPKIQERISELMAQRAKRMNITADAVVKRIADIAFGELGMLCVWTDTGLELKNRDDMTVEERAIIDTIDITPVGDGDGGLLGYKKRIKMKDSIKALELLSRHLGLLDGTGSEDKGRNSDSIKDRLLELVGRAKSKAENG